MLNSLTDLCVQEFFMGILGAYLMIGIPYGIMFANASKRLRQRTLENFELKKEIMNLRCELKLKGNVV